MPAEDNGGRGAGQLGYSVNREIPARSAVSISEPRVQGENALCPAWKGYCPNSEDYVEPLEDRSGAYNVHRNQCNHM